MAVSEDDLAPGHAADVVSGFAADTPVPGERRRPGRTDVKPQLVPLLRGKPPGPVHPAEIVEADVPLDVRALDDNSNPFRGILIGLGLVLPFWAAVGYVAMRILR